MNLVFNIAVAGLLLAALSCNAQSPKINDRVKDLSAIQNELILPGAYQLDTYLDLLRGKKVAILGNQTSEINGELLPDVLLSKGVKVVKLFSPEHGFRGVADAGAKIKNDVDSRTGLPIISLYGNNKELKKEHLLNVDVLIYDLQDVGVRFYTYISTLEYAMKACAANGVQLIILDRPNPLLDVIDGPVLEPAHKSFVGMQPIPIIYGMTPGEYAQMLVGEKWIKAESLKLHIVKINNYTRPSSRYSLPVSPSPNLKNMAAIYLYPSLCLFEGTDISLGRGTQQPFQQFGHPFLSGYDYSFTPQSMQGASDPPHNGKKCMGRFITNDPDEAFNIASQGLNLDYILEAYKSFPQKDKFFNSFFEKLAGTATLRKQIQQGLSATQIRQSWQPALNDFKVVREKYLLY